MNKISIVFDIWW